MSRKICALCLAAVLIIFLFPSCSMITDRENESKLKIVTTIFPIYDWVKAVLGESDAQVTLLLDNGVDLHSYQPTTDDIITILECDLFIYVGGESDEWTENVLELAKEDNKDMVVISLLDVLGKSAKPEEMKEGMTGETEEEDEYDEHVWLSLKNAVLFMDAIDHAIEELDLDNYNTYRNNTCKYNEKLMELNAEFEADIKDGQTYTVLFGDRFPFRYLVDDYGIDYYAAFSGCSAESEASFETIVFLANKINELNLSSVIILDGSDGKIAETIIKTANNDDIQILTLNSMQSTVAEDIQNGASYLTIMENNLNILRESLGIKISEEDTNVAN